MARYHKPGKGSTKKRPTAAPLIGCALVILLLLGFLTWTFSSALSLD